MSILIKGIGMPKKKNGAVLIIYPDGRCVFEDGKEYKAVPVPPHGKLIDADAVERNLVKMQMAQKDVVAHGIRKSRAVVRDMATVIEAESYSERELQRDYEASVEYAQHCGRYESTYDPDTGAM